jgi:hypothetical protein
LFNESRIYERGKLIVSNGEIRKWAI